VWWAGGKDRWGGTRVTVVNNVLPDVPTIDEAGLPGLEAEHR
jgi:hypothetical protein